MTILYILLIVLSAFPLWKIIRYITKENRIKKNGLNVLGVVTHIHTSAMRSGPTVDQVHIEYASIITGHFHKSSITAKHNKFKHGENLTVKYLPEEPSKIVVGKGQEYLPMLIFSILIFLFVIFAVYKIDEMVKTGNI